MSIEIAKDIMEDVEVLTEEVTDSTQEVADKAEGDAPESKSRMGGSSLSESSGDQESTEQQEITKDLKIGDRFIGSIKTYDFETKKNKTVKGTFKVEEIKNAKQVILSQLNKLYTTSINGIKFASKEEREKRKQEAEERKLRFNYIELSAERKMETLINAGIDNIWLVGDAGCGKTTMTELTAKKLNRPFLPISCGIGTSAVEFTGYKYPTREKTDFAEIVDSIRLNDPNKFVMFVFDEYEKDDYNDSTRILSFLDGASSRDNVLVIATTNDISELPTFITERPSRFEKIFEFEISNKVVFTNITECLIPDKYKESVNIDEIYTKIYKSGRNVTIDFIKIEVRRALYNILKQ